MSELHNPSIAIMASGSGSTAESFIHATQDGRINVDVEAVICNNPPEKAGIYGRISRLNQHYGLDIEMVEISSKTHPKGKVGRGQTLEESAAICKKASELGVAHIAMMGYMSIARGELVEEYGWLPSHTSPLQARLSNTHPGPLPETADTYGIHASERVLELGLKQSKHTFHLVSAGVDEGPIYAEHPVDVPENCTAQELFERVQVAEKAALPYAINDFLKQQRAFYE